MIEQSESFRYNKKYEFQNEDTDDFIISPWIETDYDSDRYQDILMQRKNFYQNLTKLKPIGKQQKKENYLQRYGFSNNENQRYQLSSRLHSKHFEPKDQNIKSYSYQQTKRNTKTNLQLSSQNCKPMGQKKLNATYRNFKGSNFKLEFRNIQGVPLHTKTDPNKTTADLNRFINLGLKNTMLKQIFHKNIEEKKQRDGNPKTEEASYSQGQNIPKLTTQGQSFYRFQTTFTRNEYWKHNYAPGRKAIYSDPQCRKMLDNSEKQINPNFSKTRQDIYKNLSIYSKSVTQIAD